MAVPPSDLRASHSIGGRTREWLVAGEDHQALTDGGLVMVGVSRARAGFHFVRHAWEHSQVLMTLAGHGRVLVDGGWRTLRAGEGYLTPAGMTHAYACPAGQTWRVAWAIIAEPEDGPRRITCDQPTVIAGDGRPLHDAIINLHRQMLGAADAALVRQWSDLVVTLVGRLVVPLQSDQRLWRIWEEVDADLGHSWTLGDLARLAGLGEEQVRRLCLRQLGVSPMQHLTRLRMRRAAALLATSERSIGQVAAIVGYANSFAFSTAFRRHHGVPPSRMRRSSAVMHER